ncbi:MAG: trimethylamine methyltransferase family protein [Spirochaetia bacterium]
MEKINASFLDERSKERIHQASLQVLEKTGILLGRSDGRAFELLMDSGARLDKDGRILIPAALVESALDKAQKGFQLYTREGEPSLMVVNGNTYFGPGSDSLYNYNKETGRLFPTDDADMPRSSSLKDIEENVRIADALGYDFIMSMSLPNDVEPKKLYPTVFAEVIKNTRKPIVFTSTRTEEIKAIYDLASIVSNSPEEHPFYVAYLEPISPLRFDRTVTKRLIYCSDRNIPVAFAPGANCGGGAPITPEAGVVQGNAESLAGLVIATLNNPNTRFIYGANTSAMDMNTMIVCYGAPEWFKTTAMYAEMGRYYSLPSWGTAGCTDARVINAQAGLEAYEGILTAILSGSTMVHDVGFLGHGEVYHPGLLVLAKVMIERARHLFEKPDLSDGRLALDVIDEVARHPGYLYLAHEHSTEYFREALWLAPRFFEKGLMEDWDPNKFQNQLLDEANRILSECTPDMPIRSRVDDVDRYLKEMWISYEEEEIA